MAAGGCYDRQIRRDWAGASLHMQQMKWRYSRFRDRGHDTVTLLPQPEPLRFPNSLFIYPVIFPSSLPVMSLGPGEGTLTTTRHLEAVKQATDPSDNPRWEGTGTLHCLGHYPPNGARNGDDITSPESPPCRYDVDIV